MSNISTEDLASLIVRATRLIHKHVSHPGKEPLSVPQIMIMGLVAKDGNPSMKDVAASLNITSPSATAAIARLVADGHLERVADDKDRRLIRLRLTDKGEAMVKEKHRLAMSRIGEVLDRLEDRDRADLSRILEKIIEDYKH